MSEEEALRKMAAESTPKAEAPWNWPKAVTVIVLALAALVCVAGTDGWLPWQ